MQCYYYYQVSDKIESKQICVPYYVLAVYSIFTVRCKLCFIVMCAALQYNK